MRTAQLESALLSIAGLWSSGGLPVCVSKLALNVNSAQSVGQGLHHALGASYQGLHKLSAGALGFFKGMRAKIVQSILAAALLMAIKEELARATAAALLPAQPPPPPPVQEPIPTAGSLVPLAR